MECLQVFPIANLDIPPTLIGNNFHLFIIGFANDNSSHLFLCINAYSTGFFVLLCMYVLCFLNLCIGDEKHFAVGFLSQIYVNWRDRTEAIHHAINKCLRYLLQIKTLSSIPKRLWETSKSSTNIASFPVVSVSFARRRQTNIIDRKTHKEPNIHFIYIYVRRWNVFYSTINFAKIFL